MRFKPSLSLRLFQALGLRLLLWLSLSAIGLRTGWADESAAAGGTIFITEYRVAGVRKLPRIAVEEAVYPYLGPGRTRDDIEAARAALEAAYQANGFQTVGVQVPARRP